MTTATAGNVAGSSDKEKDKDKEKAGVRRALGRGLASLLPGPRMVSPAAPAPQKPAATSAASASVAQPEVAGDPGIRPGAVAPRQNQPEPYTGPPELAGWPAGHPEHLPPHDSSAEAGPITLPG